MGREIMLHYPIKLRSTHEGNESEKTDKSMINSVNEKTRAIDHSKLLMKKKLKKCVHIHSLES